MKDEKDGKIIIKFVAAASKSYSYGHCVHNTANTPIAKEQVSFRSIIHNLHYNK